MEKYMEKEGEGFSERKGIDTPEEIKIPELEGIDGILEEVEKIASMAALTEEEANELLEKRFSAIEELRDLDRAVKERLGSRTEPLAGATSEEYDKLAEEGIIGEKDAPRLKKIDEIVGKLEALENPSAASAAEMERLKKLKELAGEKIESRIEERRAEEVKKMEEAKDDMLAEFAEKLSALEKIIAEAEENPKVMDRLQDMAKEEIGKIEEEKKKEKEALVKKTERYVASLLSKHSEAFKRYAEISGDDRLEDSLLEGLKKRDEQELRNKIDSVRGKVLNAVIDGEGKGRIKQPKEIMPWLSRSSVPYFDAVNFLRYRGTEHLLRDLAKGGDERAVKLLESRETIIAENEVLRMLAGKKWIVDRKTGEKKLSAVYSAFEKRRENDKKGITEERKKVREEDQKQKAEFTKVAKEVVERGGFIVREPIKKKVKGRWQEVGGRNLSVRLEEVEAKTGNKVWKIAEIVGETKNIRIGQTSPLNLGSFPGWLQKAAQNFLASTGKEVENKSE